MGSIVYSSLLWLHILNVLKAHSSENNNFCSYALFFHWHWYSQALLMYFFAYGCPVSQFVSILLYSAVSNRIEISMGKSTFCRQSEHAASAMVGICGTPSILQWIRNVFSVGYRVVGYSLYIPRAWGPYQCKTQLISYEVWLRPRVISIQFSSRRIQNVSFMGTGAPFQ